jgi:probable phosphoglycerate mutase
MARIVLIRHFETEWNRQGKIQGRADQPLAKDAAEIHAGKRIAQQVADMIWYTSPLTRAVQTAALLGVPNALHDQRLIEMDWGSWEGERLIDLRASLGSDMAKNEANGLDFRPTNGESPRQVGDRVKDWILEVGHRDTAAVTHKGVIRAVLSLALGWNMTSKPPLRADWSCAQVFTLDDNGNIKLTKANQPLDRAPS